MLMKFSGRTITVYQKRAGSRSQRNRKKEGAHTLGDSRVDNRPVSGQKWRTKQHVELSAAKNVKERNPLFDWRGLDWALDISTDNSNSAPSMWTSINMFVQTEILVMKNYKRNMWTRSETRGSWAHFWKKFPDMIWYTKWILGEHLDHEQRFCRVWQDQCNLRNSRPEL